MASFDVSPAASENVRAYAKRCGCNNDEAAEKLLTIGVNRVNALTKYGRSHAGAAKPKAKPAKKAKAKGPLARKVTKPPKSATKPTEVQ